MEPLNGRDSSAKSQSPVDAQAELEEFYEIKEQPEPLFNFSRVHKRRATRKQLPFSPSLQLKTQSLRNMLVKILVGVVRFLTNPHDDFKPIPEMSSWMEKTFTGEQALIPLIYSTLIGSHDAASHNLGGLFKRWALTQTHGIKDQLEAGARYLDIRITCNSKGHFIVHHGPVLGESASEEVLQPLTEFLREHPKEVVLMKLQFSGMTKAQITAFLQSECAELTAQHALNNKDSAGRRRPAGLINYETARNEQRNLVITINDEALDESERLTREELGDKAWKHQEQAVDMWPNASDASEVKKYNEKAVLQRISTRRNRNAQLGILQLQTNVNPYKALKGGLNSIWRLASFSNYEIPGILHYWHGEFGFSPNIILQDFIGHFNYREIAALTLALNTQKLTVADIKERFPELSEDILDARATFGYLDSRED